MSELQYAACEGKMTDIKALEASTYWDYCAFLNNYLKRIEQQKENLRKFDSEQKAKDKAKGRKNKSKR